MNKIFCDKHTITIVSNQLEADEHKHWAMQVFLSMEKDINLQVSKNSISCNCAIVNKNVSHCFSTEGQVHVSMILLPTSNIAKRLANLMNEEEYYVLDIPQLKQLQDLATHLITSDELDDHAHFIQKFKDCLGVREDSTDMIIE